VAKCVVIGSSDCAAAFGKDRSNPQPAVSHRSTLYAWMLRHKLNGTIEVSRLKDVKAVKLFLGFRIGAIGKASESGCSSEGASRQAPGTTSRRQSARPGYSVACTGAGKNRSRAPRPSHRMIWHFARPRECIVDIGAFQYPKSAHVLLGLGVRAFSSKA